MDPFVSSPIPPRRGPLSRRMSYNELSQHLFDFVVQLLPTAEEMAIKEDVRKLLEKLIRSIEPESRLLSFGSTANGFSLRNSDMDMCCLIDSKGPILPASDLVNALGDLLERETKFKVKRLPYARIPIVKLALEPSASLPYGISCDIGFENRLALENTRLLLSYASVDPTRVRTIVLFLKVWTKRRKINSPYCGTLSSYGYVLLVIYFLVHVKNPPVLPNLQQMPPLRPITPEDHHIGEHNIWFFDDIELLKQNWRSSNTETVAELLVDFFRYYSREFQYNTAVASIRAGELSKESKGWAGEGDARDPSRERNRLCIEDPFEKNYNVARTVTKDGLFLIRGEFMRAFRILVSKPDRTHSVLTQLCEERDETPLTPLTETIYPQPIPHFTSISRPALHIVDTSPRSIPVDRLSPPQNFFGTSTPPDDELRTSQEVAVADRPLPEHMAPTRSKWTSPPPPDASPTDLESYNKQLGLGLTLATSSNAREPEPSSLSSRSSEATDDDLRSNPTDSQPPSPPSDAPSPASFFTARRPPPIQVQPGGNASSDSTKDDGAGQTPKPTQASSEQEQTRGRAMERLESGTSFGVSLPRNGDTAVPPTSDQPRRASSGPPSLRGSESSSSSSPPDKAPKNLRSRQQKGPPLTLDTAYFGTTAPTPPVISPASIPGTSRVHATTPYVATAPHIPYRPSIYSPPVRQHYHSGSGPSHYPGSVTIYRSQPQATTFPLYQQSDHKVSPTSSASPSSPVARNQDTNHPVGPTPKKQSPTSNPRSTKPRPSPSAVAPTALAESPRSQSRTKHTTNKPTPVSTKAPSPSSTRSKGKNPPSSGSSTRNTSRTRGLYDPSAAFRIPTTVLPPSPPESTKSFNSSSARTRDCSTSSSGSSPGRGTSPRSSPGMGSTPGIPSSTEPVFVWPVL